MKKNKYNERDIYNKDIISGPISCTEKAKKKKKQKKEEKNEENYRCSSDHERCKEIDVDIN